jgi:erythromycin esterase-like protein
MWANAEVAELIDWLRKHNDSLTEDKKAGFFGLDVYSLWDSLYAILGYLQRSDPSVLPEAWRAMRCFEPYGEDDDVPCDAIIVPSLRDELLLKSRG